MVSVQHAGDTIESETIEVVFLHPETQVAEQEAQNLVVAVVEQSAVPQLMSSLGALMEVQVVAAVEHVQTIEHVLGCVAVHHVQQHGDSHAMCSINELLEVIWEAIATARRKEAVDLVAETGVVGMLHDCHQLNSVVAQVLDAGQDVLGKLLVGRYLGLG